MVCKPCARLVGVNDQTPLALAVVVPSTVEPSIKVTVAFGSALPVSASNVVMSLPPLVSSASEIGSAGGVSSVKVSDEDPVSPVALVSLAVMVCKPCARLVGVNDHTPLASAVVVPSTVEPSVKVTVAFGSALPVSASFVVMSLPPLVSSASAIVTIGAVVS